MRALSRILLLVIIAVVGSALYVRFAPLELTVADANPYFDMAPEEPNWALAAPNEAGLDDVRTIEAGVYAAGPEELMSAFEEVALSQPRVEPAPLATGDPLLRAFVQRSALMGFPDVISVRAIDLGAGDAGTRAGLVIYSRSVYGYSDLGVNGERVASWLAALDDRVERVR